MDGVISLLSAPHHVVHEAAEEAEKAGSHHQSQKVEQILASDRPWYAAFSASALRFNDFANVTGGLSAAGNIQLGGQGFFQPDKKNAAETF